VLVLNNEDLNQVTWEMRAQSGDPKFNASQQIPNVAYARYAELLGLKGIYCDDPKKVGACWDEAFSSDRPCVLEVKTDPNIPPLPPHISLKEAKAFATTLLKGDPEEASVITKSIRQLAEEFLPH
jgi:pyruvate dehydrogenase (quinone)